MTSSLTSHAIQAEEAGAILTIDLRALAENWKTLDALSGKAECGAVVKANAYGLGIEQAVPALFAAGCRTFFVAHLGEAVRARKVCPSAIIYVLNGLRPGTGSVYLNHDLRPVIGSLSELDEWVAFCATSNMRLPAALHVDTGMQRLGFAVSEVHDLARHQHHNRFTPSLVMSHFVSSEISDDPLSARQIAAFDTVRQAFPDIPASLCNSSGIFLAQAPHFDLTRPGYALYGGNPTPGRANPMRPVVRLEAFVIQTRWVESGETVGYNATWTAPGRRRLATLSVGYADGFPFGASNTDQTLQAGATRGAALIAGRLCPFAGRVSMDLISVDITDVPEDRVSRGSRAVLIGDDLNVDEVGRRAGTIGYTVLTGLGARYARRYIPEGSV